jgi:ABC-type multidrug transport system permease subunit
MLLANQGLLCLALSLDHNRLEGYYRLFLTALRRFDPPRSNAFVILSLNASGAIIPAVIFSLLLFVTLVRCGVCRNAPLL